MYRFASALLYFVCYLVCLSLAGLYALLLVLVLISKMLKFYVRVFMRWARRCQGSYPVCGQVLFDINLC